VGGYFAFPFLSKAQFMLTRQAKITVPPIILSQALISNR
jgi:hypothetical protein